MLVVYRTDGVSMLLLYSITLQSEKDVKYLIPKWFYPWFDTNINLLYFATNLKFLLGFTISS